MGKEPSPCRSGQGMNGRRSGRAIATVLAVTLFQLAFFITDLWAFSIIEDKMFTDGPYLFKVEVQVSGRGSLKKRPMQLTSLKVKIKNDRASSKTLLVKSIRTYFEPQAYQDMETKGYSIVPAQWVTKYYRLPKNRQISLGEEAFIEIAFETFSLRFRPGDRKFQGPIK